MLNQKKYLLIPAFPTPNGRLHLGHIGGPYLSADILARHLRISGHQATILTGTDDFESYVMLQAAKKLTTPEYICSFYNPLIAADLKAMDIEIAHFVQPSHPLLMQTYLRWHEIIFQTLQNKNACQKLKENMIWDSINQRFKVGCWQIGFCPSCKEKTESYFCEACGTHYRPEEIIQQNNQELIKQVENIFLCLKSPPPLKNKGINLKLEQLYHQFLHKQNYLFRLTTQAAWGLKCNQSSTFFSYGFVFAYALMLGELQGKIEGNNLNAFAIDSSTITIASFGHDNFIPFISSILGISSYLPEYKPFDFYLINYFFNLNGLKFSTSRRHAIWVDDVINHQQLSSDIIRLYLASIDIHTSSGNFSSQDFSIFYNQTLDWQNQLVLKMQAMLPDSQPNSCDSDLKDHLQKLLDVNKQVLQPNHFFPHQAIKNISLWLKLANQLPPYASSNFWWLQAFSLFISPFMPKLGQGLWQALGYPNQPSIHQLFTKPSLPFHRKLTINQTPLTADSIIH
ncbi:methionyl-tRNA synthetase [Legionella busanensis]|uniref:Methionyl-tRNA synthetase n=1 Tax=Legionella busanensis TaxID=190655 RepID=A0A378JK36_9GAMM|nr:class I tRNA ligase family protein [Legionella busanensis]STX50510.1 methionyl-tRNA synthetase [Legionella busanensis]